MSDTSDEILGQPQVWKQAAGDGATARTTATLPLKGASVMVMGCGTSAFVSHSMARLREYRGHGPTDWAYASELAGTRGYDHVLVVTRSGTTSEISQALAEHAVRGENRTCFTADPNAPVPVMCDHVVDLSFAEERSIVQTRFPTSVLAYWRAWLGEDLAPAIGDCERAVGATLPVDASTFDHFVFLGRGWTVGLAHEAALKMRECAQAWSESYPALDYRHGPIAVAGPRSLVISLGEVERDLLRDVQATGATVLDEDGLDPLARLVTCQRLAVAAAEHRGLDVDRPRNLTRSVILSTLEESR